MIDVNRRVLPGFGLSLGYTMLYMSFMVAVPMAAGFYKAASLSFDDFIRAAFSDRALAAYWLTVWTSFASAVINVVFGGRLSLVGPRPHALQAKADNRLYQDVVDGYFARHKVKPGLSGWAQINGWRGETDTAEKIQKRVEHDFWYIENWSVFLDLYILARTPFALLKAENAY